MTTPTATAVYCPRPNCKEWVKMGRRKFMGNLGVPGDKAQCRACGGWVGVSSAGALTVLASAFAPLL